MKGIIAVVVAVSRLARITVASQIRKDDGVFLGECRRDLVPRQVCLWVAVDKNQRPAVSFGENVDFSAGCPNPPSFESGQESLRGGRRRRFGEFAQTGTRPRHWPGAGEFLRKIGWAWGGIRLCTCRRRDHRGKSG